MSEFQSLSGSELEIMQAIWDMTPPVTSGEVMERFADRAWKAQTLSTFLTRLVEKGLLDTQRQGRTNHYTPQLTAEEYRQREAAHVLDSMYHGSLQNFLSAFYGGKGLSQTEAEELKRWFDREARHD